MYYEPYYDSSNRLLVIYNETDSIKQLKSGLKTEGWKVLFTRDSTEALHIAEKELPDLVILYLSKSRVDEYEILRRVGNNWQIPVILIGTSSKIISKAKYLNLGADDYITEPVSIEELTARIRALLRRNKGLTCTSFYCGNLKIDFDARRVTAGGIEIKLTPTEFKLLHFMVVNAGKVLPHKYLLSRVWGSEYEQSREYLHVFINRLRAKIEPDPRNPEYIITMSGIGYRFQRTD